MKTLKAMTGVLMVCLVATTMSIAAVPGTITYQGRLTDQPGTALNGNVNIVFSIYSVASGGSSLWQETQSGVSVQKGLFTVELGAVTPFSPTLFSGADLYLGIKVGTDAEMTPRQKLNSVPFAVKASVADGLSSVGMSNQIVSTVPTGTAPMQITSTTVVGNLNADLLDGQHAADIIAASADEVRTPISACGTISTSGSYYLTGNITATGTCLTVTANNVTIDLMGFTITGPGSGTNYGIYTINRSNIEIKNGTITNFGSIGIYEVDSSQKGHRVINVTVSANGVSGIQLNSHANLVKACTAINNGTGSGIYVANGSTVTGSVAVGNGDGIAAGVGCTVSGNTAYGNSGIGIKGGAESVITGNAAVNNNSTGIYTGTGVVVVGNIARGNGGSGISAEGFGLVKDNAMSYNSFAGLTVASRCRVVGNMLSNNTQNNIVVSGADNILRENHVVQSGGYGIRFDASGNYYKENTASGNTSGNFYLGTTTQTDGGGNVGF